MGLREGRSGWTRAYLTPLQVPLAGTDLTANTALVLGKCTPGFSGIVEEFGYVIDSLSTGTPALLFHLLDAGANVVAALTLGTTGIVTSKARGDVQKTSTFAASGDGIRPKFARFHDDTVLTLKRISGTAATGTGTGHFYVKVAQKPQQA